MSIFFPTGHTRNGTPPPLLMCRHLNAVNKARCARGEFQAGQTHAHTPAPHPHTQNNKLLQEDCSPFLSLPEGLWCNEQPVMELGVHRQGCCVHSLSLHDISSSQLWSALSERAHYTVTPRKATTEHHTQTTHIMEINNGGKGGGARPGLRWYTCHHDQ